MNQVSRSSKHLWTPFKIYAAYRQLLSFLLIGLNFTGFTDKTQSQLDPLYLYSSIFFLFSCLVTLIWIRQSASESKLLKFSIVTTDIIIITLLAHASGGLNSNLSILLVVSVAAGGIMIVGRAGTLIAAIATLAVLFEQAYFSLTSQSDTPITNAGFLGIAFFAVSLLSQVLAKQLGESQKRASISEAHLAEWQELSHRIIQRMRTGIIVLSSQGNIQLLNATSRKLLQLNTRPNSSDHLQSACPELYNQFAAWQEGHSSSNKPFKVNQTGPTIRCDFTELKEDHNASRILAFLEDATTLAQQAQHLKLASLATLTAGIAHEIRNPLGAISHAAQLLLESEDLHPSDLKLANIIQQHSVRMNNIIENVLYLSRRKKPIPVQLILNEWLVQFIKSFKESYGKPCSLILETKQEHIAVQIDQSQLSQVLTNLIENALRYSLKEIQQAKAILIIGVSPSSDLPYLQIQDFGPGINEDQQAKLFEPFYTSEANGTGLGLYLARELCEINHARLGLKASDEPGCCFQITFPHPNKRVQEKD